PIEKRSSSSDVLECSLPYALRQRGRRVLLCALLSWRQPSKIRLHVFALRSAPAAPVRIWRPLPVPHAAERYERPWPASLTVFYRTGNVLARVARYASSSPKSFPSLAVEVPLQSAGLWKDQSPRLVWPSAHRVFPRGYGAFLRERTPPL